MRGLREVARRVIHLLVGVPVLTLYALVIVPAARITSARRRKAGLRPRIVWGPVPIVNIKYSSRADRLYGYSSETLVYSVYSINSRAGFDRVLDGLARVPLVGLATPYFAFLRAGFAYEICGFFYDGGLLWATPFWRAELALLRLAGKKIVVYPYGSDARLATPTRQRGGWHAYSDIPEAEEDRDEQEVRRRLAAFARYANAMLGCADLYEDLPRCDGIFRYPFDGDGWSPVEVSDDQVIRVVHAPNHRHYKGTRYLVEAVEQLQREGLPVELVMVEGVPTEEARRTYERAHVIADQFLIGAYALFAIEGMALGKPVICYLNPRFIDAHPEWLECPIVSASPDDLVDQLRSLVLDPARRAALGARGPGYVARYHSLASVGRDMDEIYRSLWR